MKYEYSRPAKIDQDISVYLFSFGIQEMELLKAVLDRSFKYTPKITETTQTIGRLRNMRLVLERFFKEKERDKRRENQRTKEIG